MNWENIGPTSEEPKPQSDGLLGSLATRMEEELTESEMIQLKKFQDPANNLERQACLALLAQFGELLVAKKITGLIDSILSSDCEFFLLSSTGRTPLQHCHQLRDLENLYKGMQIQERIVRETYIDLEKGIACTLCNYRIQYEDEENPVDEIAAEIFTIKNNKISKYRAFFGKMTPAHEDSDPFEITDRDRALALVKKINYALADQPNFEKVADFLHDNAKYKIWSWDSKKCFMFEKHNFVKTFQDMQENFVIKSIIPYDVSTQGQVAVGTYVYHLEGKTGDHANKNYVWLTNCYYLFDADYKIVKVSQQGELYLKGEKEIQSVVYSRDKLLQKIHKVYSEGLSADLFYGDVFALGVTAHTFGREGVSFLGLNKGTAVIDKVIEWNKKNIPDSLKRIKLVESIVDSCNSSHDVVILIHRIYREIDPLVKQNDDVKPPDTIVVTRYKLEQGKIIKACGLITSLPGPAPSSFE